MFPASLNLSELNGKNGFVIQAIDQYDSLGTSVSNAGDINGDGFDDIIIGAPDVGEPTPAGRYSSSRGAIYVLFGEPNLGSNNNIQLTSLNGNNGFSIEGVNDYDSLGTSVSNAGDINGDGVDDIIFSGDENYVVFGGSDVGNNGKVELASLDGTNGFVLKASNYNNTFVSNAGDLNGDGVDDIIIGVPQNQSTNEGTTYVVFGSNNIGNNGSLELSSLDGTDGFALKGIDDNDFSGSSVSNLGDVNGDGFDDIIIGAPDAGPLILNPFPFPQILENNRQGESYVVFGGSDIGSNGNVDLSSLDGTNGIILTGFEEAEKSGISVSSAGDVNNDGIKDILIATRYVVFGSQNLGNSPNIDLSELDGSNGFVLTGDSASSVSNAASSVSNAGDVNGDGISDLIIGSQFTEDGGKTYVVFGKSGIGSTGTLNLSSLDGNNGFVLNAINQYDRLGSSVSNAGDVNSDGIDEIIIGAPNYNFSGSLDGGESYVVFGSKESPSNTIQGTPGNDVLNGTANNDVIEGLAGNDSVQGLAGNDFLFGNNGFDLLFGNAGNDSLEGGLGGDTLKGGADNDLLQGNSGFDVLSGNNGNDLLVGGNDNDVLRGSVGNDTLDGGSGNDSLFGGNGADFFILRAGEGTKSIIDYRDGVDKFILAGGLEFGQIEIVQNINNTQIQLSDSNEVLANLNSVTANSLDSSDFIQG